MTPPLSLSEIQSLGELDSCTVANAIETFDVRLRNTGFTDSTVRCIFEDFPPMVGYAATARVHSSDPPMEGSNYYDRTDWWAHILTIPAPRIVVVEDTDRRPGLGAFIGELHANILLALGCIGVVTNGAVRDLREVRKTGFQMFARNVSVSHSFAHIYDFGRPVEVGGMQVHPGNLLHGDIHGVQTVPIEIAGRIPAVAHEMAAEEQRLIAICRSKNFTIEKFREALKSEKKLREPK
ncbi:MAG TPA: RraA family protein [Candidatus Acidoferrales bacterium]|jgi:regulator of RNase E activity RraA|nr:RraA family protein [Candidatus Acidoferrales bacterium]